LGLVIQHKDKLGAYSAVTPDVLQWLDACDKIARSGSIRGLDTKGYQEVLKNLATRYRDSGFLNHSNVLEAIGPLTTNPRAALFELESEGVLKDEGIGYNIVSDRLALSMGLWLLEELKSAHKKRENLFETIIGRLSPDQETEGKIAWLRSATVIALLVTPALPEEIVDVMVDTWLRSRNLSRPDFQEIKALRGLLLQPLLRLVPKTWSLERGSQRLQELSRLVFVDALHSPQKEVLSKTVRDWFRLVPARGSFLLQNREQEPESVVRSAIENPELADLGLKVDDEEVVRLHKVGLYLLSRASTLVSVEDLFSLFVAKTLTLDYLEDGKWFVVRRALASVGRAWFENQVSLLPEDTDGLRRRALHSLIRAGEREDLHDLYAETTSTSGYCLDRVVSRGKFNRARYEEFYDRPFAVDENPRIFVEFSGEVVCNPGLPKPCDARITVLHDIVIRTFTGVELGSHRSVSSEDVLLERGLPALAAWMPDIGADIVRQQMLGLPARAMDRRWRALRRCNCQW